MRHQFIQEHQGQFRTTTLLRMLDVSASAFYGWQNRPVSQRAQQKERLVTHINELFQESQGRYGSPRIHRDLQALGIPCSPKRVARFPKRVARLMKEQSLVARKFRRFVVITDSDHAHPIALNLLNREYQVEAVTGLNRAWAGDITDIATAQGWLYVAVVVDLLWI